MPSHPDTEEMLRRAESGDSLAAASLFDRYRNRLRRMVAARIDARLVSRVDPSDVVQEALFEAHRLFPAYLRERPVAFYPWLKQIAINRLVDVHRRHVIAKNRSVRRESRFPQKIDPSTDRLVDQLFHEDSAATRLIRNELVSRVQLAIDKLPINLRDILLLRFAERRSAAEIAATLKISEGTVRSRQFRALKQLRKHLDDVSD